MSKSEPRADVWMPLYIGDYLADTARLTTEQHGAYLLLIMDYWRNGAPPDDDEVLRNITRFSKFLWKKNRPILENFFTVKEGKWTHSRIDEEISKALSSKAAAAEKASNAAKARWEKRDAPSIDQALLEECPSPSPSPLPKEPKSKAQKPASPSFDLPDWVPVDSWNDFVAMRKASRNPMAEAAMRLAVAKLDELRAQGNDPKAVLDQSTLRSWRGLFPVKVETSAGPAAPQKPRFDDWFRSDAGITRKASELGIFPRSGESYANLRERCENELRKREQRIAA